MHGYKSVVSCATYKMGEYKIYLKGLDRVRKTHSRHVAGKLPTDVPCARISHGIFVA